jgi:hypothetical protein
MGPLFGQQRDSAFVGPTGQRSHAACFPKSLVVGLVRGEVFLAPFLRELSNANFGKMSWKGTHSNPGAARNLLRRQWGIFNSRIAGYETETLL